MVSKAYGKLVVDEIHLGYTTFHDVDNGTICQIRHSKLCTEKIENLSWSKIHYPRETLYFESRLTNEDLKKVEGLKSRGIQIKRYFDYSIRLPVGSETGRVYIDIVYKPRV